MGQVQVQVQGQERVQVQMQVLALIQALPPAMGAWKALLAVSFVKAASAPRTQP